MATLTVNVPFSDNLLRKVDEYAQKEDRSREDFISQATAVYLRAKEWDEICVEGRRHGQRHGITEEVINEEIRLYREEQERSKK